MNRLLNLSASPHLRAADSTRGLMLDVAAALLPASVFGIYRFGAYALCILLVSVFFAVYAELVFECLIGEKVTVRDGSALVTGMLVGLNMPPTVPLWIPMLGSIFAIVVVKELFGGLGQNFVNPAMAARCFLLISFTGIMTSYPPDAVSGATELALLKTGGHVDTAAMFTGLLAGNIGEVSVPAILAGGIYLRLKRVISFRIPVLYLGSFTIFMAAFGGHGLDASFLAAQLFGGGLMLAAWFMATDYTTSPLTARGSVLYAVLLGILTGIFRVYGGAAEGTSYAILIGNLLVPLLERFTIPKAFGWEE